MKHLSILMAVAMMIFGCGNGDIGDFCHELVDCEDGNDADEDACRHSVEATEKIAEDYDCSDEFDEYMSCMVEESSCTGDGYSDDGACNDDEDDLWECEEDATGY